MTLVRTTLSRPCRFALPGLRVLAPIAGAGLAAAILHSPAGDPLAWACAALATAALVAWIVWQDLATYTVPDAALVALTAIAAALRCTAAAGEPTSLVVSAMALDVGLCGGLLLAFREAYYRLKGVDGLGLGDVKLAAAGALLAGGVAFSWALFAASVAGLAAVGVARRVSPGRARIERLAFGAVLAPAVWGMWFATQALPRLLGG